MFVSRKLRPILCLLLAVATAMGTVLPARACACATPVRAPVIPASERAAKPAPAAKPCCQTDLQKRSCCSPGSTCGTVKTSCCDKQTTTGRTGQPAQPADVPGCHCLRCECETPAVPPAAHASLPVAPDLDGPATVSPVPVVLISDPSTAAARSVRSAPAGPPTDLVISLSRFTC